MIALAGYYKNVDSNIGYTQFPRRSGAPPTRSPARPMARAAISRVPNSLSTPFWFVPGLEFRDLFECCAGRFEPEGNDARIIPFRRRVWPSSRASSTCGIRTMASTRAWHQASQPPHRDLRLGRVALTRMESETTLGASVSYAITKMISLRVQANNLTNQAARFYFANDPNQIARYEKYGRSYLADVTVKF
jgi:hypothetical protein